MINVQKYLLNKSLNCLKQEHGIEHRIKDHKISLNYNQIETKENDPLGKECRGIILVPTENYNNIPIDLPLGPTKIMARPFDRFFNYGQTEAANIDFFHPKTKIYEKMDGTLSILYFDFIKQDWCVATRSVSEADISICGYKNITFRTLFEQACLNTIHIPFSKFVEELDKGITYLFELTTPINQIVVEHNDYKITLLGARDNFSGKEYDPIIIANKLSVPYPQLYSFSTLEDLLIFISSVDPKKNEGVVVCDQYFQRIKIKNPAYVALNRLKDTTTKSPRSLLELILLEKLDDNLSLLPEYVRNKGIELQEKLHLLNKQYNISFKDCINYTNKQCDISNIKEHRKTFALCVKNAKLWVAPMMDRYSGNCYSLIEWINNKKLPNNEGWNRTFLDNILSQLEQ